MLRKFCRDTYVGASILLLKSQKWCLKHSKPVTIVFFAATLVVATQISKLKIVFSAEDLAGEGLPSADELVQIKKRFREGVTSMMILSPDTGRPAFSIEELCTIRRWYSRLRVTIPELKIATSTFDFKWPVRTAEDRIVIRNFLDLDCEKLNLGSSLEIVQKQINSSPFALGINQQPELNLLFQITFDDSTTSKFGTFDPKLVDYLRDSVNNELLPKLQNVHTQWVGPADYQWYILEGFNFSKWVNMTMLLMILIFLKVFLGTWKSGLIYCTTLFLTAIWVFGLKGFFGSSFDVLSTGLFLIIGISSLEDYVFVSGEMAKGKSWRAASRRILVPGFFTSFTTIIGFLSLGVSELEAIRRMGLWSATGALIEWSMCFLFLPAFLKVLSFKGTWALKNHRFQFLSGLTTRALPPKMAVVACLVFPLGLYFMQNFNYNESPENTFPESHVYRQDLKQFKKDKGWVGVTSLLFEPGISKGQAEEQIRQIMSDPWTRDFVVKYESPNSIIDWYADLKLLPRELVEVQFENTRLHNVYVDADNNVRSLMYVKDTTVNNIKTLKDKVFASCNRRCHLGGEVVTYSDFSSGTPMSLVDSLVASLFLVSLVIVYIAIAVGQESKIPALLLSSYWGPFLMILLVGAFGITIDFWKSIFASILVGLAGDNALQYLGGARKSTLQNGIVGHGASSILTGGLMSITALAYLGSYFASPREFGVILSLGMLAGLVGDLWLLNSMLAFKVRFKIWGTSRAQVVTSSTGSSNRVDSK